MLDPALEAVEEVIEAQDPAAFDETFARLTATCNACHKVEDVAFIHIGVPGQRRSSVRPAARSAD